MDSQWLLTSSTDKFGSFRLSIFRFQPLHSKSYRVFVRTGYFTFLSLYPLLARVTQKIIVQMNCLIRCFPLAIENWLFFFLTITRRKVGFNED